MTPRLIPLAALLLALAPIAFGAESGEQLNLLDGLEKQSGVEQGKTIDGAGSGGGSSVKGETSSKGAGLKKPRKPKAPKEAAEAPKDTRTPEQINAAYERAYGGMSGSAKKFWGGLGLIVGGIAAAIGLSMLGPAGIAVGMIAGAVLLGMGVLVISG